jgi:hypothetical protein
MAWNCSKIRNLPYVRRYEEALELWNKAPRPNATHLRGPWSTYQRPLAREYDTPFRFHHYRLERHEPSAYHDGDYFDVVLYRTAMARYHKPEGDKRVVLYNGHDSAASKQFRWSVLDISESIDRVTTDGKKVWIPIGGGGARIHDDRDYFTTKLTYVGDKVLVSESDHPSVYKHKTSAHERALRKQVKATIGNAVMLAVMRMHQYREFCDPDRRKAKPFKGADPNWQTKDVLKTLCKDPGHLSEVGWERFFDFGQDVFDSLVSKRLRVEGGSYGTRWAYAELERPVSEVDFMRSLVNAIINHGMEYVRPDHVDVPKFSPVEDIPKTNFHLR